MSHYPPDIEDENYDAPEPVLAGHPSCVTFEDHRRKHVHNGKTIFKARNNIVVDVIAVTTLILLICIFGTKLENCGPDTKGLLLKAVYLKLAIILYLAGGIYLLNKSNIKPALMATLNVLICLGMIGFYIYIIFKLFSHNNSCRQSFNLLLAGHILLFLEALLIFVLCCTVCCAFICLYITLLDLWPRIEFNWSNGEQVQIERQDTKVGRISLSDLLLNAASLQIDPEDYRNMGECTICLEQFIEIDLIIALPCHEAHIFHPKCIADLSKKTDKCPLCKQKIDREALESIQRDNSPLFAQNN
ncbi:unnamed protein product [Moneuplotes crassus]|uniref:RING-type E3 ubiquitin transferase n=1 Tax=Euplotes crassus TaxID=5936 RepID=A0AAD1XRZ9_EUPCR|nr:unnamed protein product [Moneuplotes crassus]